MMPNYETHSTTSRLCLLIFCMHLNKFILMKNHLQRYLPYFVGDRIMVVSIGSFCSFASISISKPLIFKKVMALLTVLFRRDIP